FRVAVTSRVISARFSFPRPATPAIYTLALHDALPISPPTRPSQGPALRTTRRPAPRRTPLARARPLRCRAPGGPPPGPASASFRSEEHTSELQSRENLVCRLLLEKKKRTTDNHTQRRA